MLLAVNIIFFLLSKNYILGTKCVWFYSKLSFFAMVTFIFFFDSERYHLFLFGIIHNCILFNPFFINQL